MAAIETLNIKAVENLGWTLQGQPNSNPELYYLINDDGTYLLRLKKWPLKAVAQIKLSKFEHEFEEAWDLALPIYYGRLDDIEDLKFVMNLVMVD